MTKYDCKLKMNIVDNNGGIVVSEDFFEFNVKYDDDDEFEPILWSADLDCCCCCI